MPEGKVFHSFLNERLIYVPGETIEGFVNLVPETTFSYDRLKISMRGMVTEHNNIKCNFEIFSKSKDDKFPAAWINVPKDNIALAGENYKLPFSFTIPEQLEDPCHDNLLHNRLPPSVEGEIKLPFMNINNNPSNYTHYYSHLRTEDSQKKWKINHEYPIYDTEEILTSRICRISSGIALSKNRGPNIFPLSRNYDGSPNVQIFYCMEATIECESSTIITPYRSEYSPNLMASRNFVLVPSYPALSHHLLRPYLDTTKYVSAENFNNHWYWNENMKLKTIHSIDSKTGNLLFYKYFEWLTEKENYYLNQMMSTIKVISSRPDPILYLPQNITRMSDEYLPKKSVPYFQLAADSNSIYPLKFIYSPISIDGVLQPPPSITDLKPRLLIHTIIGVSISRLDITEDVKEYPLTYRIREVTFGGKYDQRSLKNDKFEYDKLFLEEDHENWGKWTPKYDEIAGRTIYERILEIEIPSITASHLVPSFQSCYLSRSYELEIQIEFKSPELVPVDYITDKIKRGLKILKSSCGLSTNGFNFKRNRNYKTAPAESKMKYNSLLYADEKSNIGSVESRMNYNSFDINHSMFNCDSYCFSLNIPIDICLKPYGDASTYPYAMTEKEILTSCNLCESSKCEKATT